jgi:hypothetical protein
MRQVRIERIVGDDVYWLQMWKGKRDKVVVGGLVGGGVRRMGVCGCGSSKQSLINPATDEPE